MTTEGGALHSKMLGTRTHGRLSPSRRRRSKARVKGCEDSATNAASAVSRKMQALGTIAGGVAHDFNRLLAPIILYGELAQQCAVEGSSMRRYLDNIIVAASRAQELADRRAIDRFAGKTQPDEVETAKDGERGQIADNEGSQTRRRFVAHAPCYEPKAAGDHTTSDRRLQRFDCLHLRIRACGLDFAYVVELPLRRLTAPGIQLTKSDAPRRGRQDQTFEADSPGRR